MTRSLPAVALFAVVAFASPALAQSTSQPPAQPPAQPAAQPAQPAPSTASSQPPSLGELAKQEEARRKAAAERGDLPKKVYTNHDLRPAPGPDTTSADTTGSAAGDQQKSDKTADASTADDKSAQGDKDKAGDKPAPEQTEQYWHDRMQKAKDDLQHNQMYAEALQSRINGLSADFAARDDPYQRAQIADDRQKALAELDRVNEEIKKGTQAISDIEDEARKANIPAGWIR